MSEARKALEVLKTAAAVFQTAVDDFGDVFETETVGLDEWNEHTGEVLYDIEADIDSVEEDEEDDEDEDTFVPPKI